MYASPYLGDVQKGTVLVKCLNTLTSLGASITRSTDGTVALIKDGDFASPITAGITVTEDAGGTGLHKVSIDTGNAAIARKHDYELVVTGQVVNSNTQNMTIFSFSLENRVPRTPIPRRLLES